MKKRIALFGGAFDPVHLGHVQVAENIIGRFGFDETWVMPTFDHTFGKKLTPGNNRLAMCEIAFRNLDVYVSAFEISNKVTGGTYEVLKALSAVYPDYAFSMVIGSDNILNIKKWKNWEKLTAEYPFIVIQRKGFDADGVSLMPSNGPMVERLTGYIQTSEIVEYSSTKVRNDIASGIQPQYIDPQVYDYIKAHNLYGAVK